MKAIGLIVLLLILLPIGILAQSAEEPGLVLRDGKGASTSKPCEREDENHTCFAYRMVLENEGKEPVIIINPTLGYGTGIKEVIFFYREYGKEPHSYIQVEGARKRVEINPVEQENFKSMVRVFEDERPPENMTIVLQPGEKFTFVDSFQVESEKLIPEAEFEAIRRKHPTGYSCSQKGCSRDWSYLRLVYEFSFLPYVSDPDFLDKLSLRWRRFGRLPVGSNGVYTITSELIR
jgi:hypothetical protein